MNLLNLNQVLAVSAFIGAVSCKSWADYKTDVQAALDKPTMTKEHKENVINALKHPQIFVNKKFDLNAMHSLSAEEIAKEPAYKFFRYDEIDTEKLTSALKSKNFTEVKEKHEKKLEYLQAILKEVPVLSGIMAGAADDNDNQIMSQVTDVMYDALTFDGERLAYSNLHKLVESLKGAFESPRKAEDAAKAVIKALDSVINDTNVKVQTGTRTFEKVKEFHVAATKEEKKQKAEAAAKKAKDDAAAGKTEDKKPEPINFLKIAQKASDKSTSSPNNLFYTLVASLMVSIAALLFKGFFAAPSKDEDFEDQH